uniref:hypothetical protein n=1 Tax=Clostridium sp. NkU-1 TaxID=1095009 RepID=UPI000AF9A5EA
MIKQNIRFAGAVLLSISGFLTAILANLLVRQVADVKINSYTMFGRTVDINEAYRFVLFVLIVLYAGLCVYAFFRKDSRVKYLKRAPFRLACGIALTVWDIIGTKYLLLPQPFFPGPARIIEPFLMEPDFIFENTLYSLRLFVIGFGIGVFAGVATGILIGWFPKVYYWFIRYLRSRGSYLPWPGCPLPSRCSLLPLRARYS